MAAGVKILSVIDMQITECRLELRSLGYTDCGVGDCLVGCLGAEVADVSSESQDEMEFECNALFYEATYDYHLSRTVTAISGTDLLYSGVGWWPLRIIFRLQSSLGESLSDRSDTGSRRLLPACVVFANKATWNVCLNDACRTVDWSKFLYYNRVRPSGTSVSVDRCDIGQLILRLSAKGLDEYSPSYDLLVPDVTGMITFVPPSG